MRASGWAASWPAIWVSRALIWADSAVSVAVRTAVTPAWEAPSVPAAPGGAACSRACSSLAGALRRRALRWGARPARARQRRAVCHPSMQQILAAYAAHGYELPSDYNQRPDHSALGA
jgi:hypothetical protein